MLTPKSGELVADPQRSGGDPAAAEAAFEKGFERAFRFLAARCRVDVPMAVFYAFKQTEESDEDGVASTGWETMLAALIRAGFGITGTWPIRTERFGRTNSLETNALASSIVLVCRLRPSDAGITDRRGFITALRSQLPSALRELQAANIAPVDLAQAAIGPGMAVFSRYARVVEADGSAMRVRTALGLINQALDEVLSEQEGEFDPDTRWAVAWFEQNGFQPGRFGDAETLSKAKVTSIDRLAEAGIVSSRSGVVQLLHREELDVRRGPDARDASIWALTQRLIHALESDSEAATARLLAEAGGQSEAARDLAYRLFVSAERRGWAADALSFNALVTAWPELPDWRPPSVARCRKRCCEESLTMAVSNRDRVGKGLDCWQRALSIRRRGDAGRRACGQRLGSSRCSGGARPGAQSSLDDPQFLLKTLWDYWNPVFSKVLGRNERSMVSLLRDVRDRWAHNEAFTGDDAYRALDGIQMLLQSVAASSQADEVGRSKDELLRLRYEDAARKAARGPAAVGAETGGLTPWREVVTPHADVRSGTFAQAEFAADLAQVHRGEGTDRVP